MTADKGILTWTRKGTMGGLSSILAAGNSTPGRRRGSHSLKTEAGETSMTVNDPGLVLSVTRKK